MTAGASPSGLGFAASIAALIGIAILWLVLVAPSVRRDAEVLGAAPALQGGQTFPEETLQRIVATPAQTLVGGGCRPQALRARVYAASALVQMADRQIDFALFDSRMAVLEEQARTLAACDPNDAFGWLMLYWIEVQRRGFGHAAAAFLRRSYETGPHEGWIAARRNPLAIRVIGALDPDLQASVRREWALLVNAMIMGPPGDVIDYVAEDERARLFAEQHRIRPGAWRMFADHLQARGVEVALPNAPPTRRRLFHVNPG